MKRFLAVTAVAAAAATTFALPASAADVGVSVNIGQPGFFGQIDIGGYPPPPLLYPQPVAIESVPPNLPPIYLNVPPDQASHWRVYCHQYNACGQRVLFVQNDWYNRTYAPRYQTQHHMMRPNEHRDDHRDPHADPHANEHHDDPGH